MLNGGCKNEVKANNRDHVNWVNKSNTAKDENTKQKNAAAEICFCFGTLGVEYFMNLEPEENNNSVNKEKKTKEVASKRWFFLTKWT